MNVLCFALWEDLSRLRGIYIDTVSPAIGACEVAPVGSFDSISRSYPIESLGDQRIAKLV